MNDNWLFIIMWAVVSFLIFIVIISIWHSAQDNQCFKDCHNSSEFQNMANTTQLGIDHVCYDYCVGGISKPFNIWEWVMIE